MMRAENFLGILGLEAAGTTNQERTGSGTGHRLELPMIQNLQSSTDIQHRVHERYQEQQAQGQGTVENIIEWVVKNSKNVKESVKLQWPQDHICTTQ